MQENILNLIIDALKPKAHDEIDSLIKQVKDLSNLPPEVQELLKGQIGGTSVAKVAKTTKHVPSLLKQLLGRGGGAGATGGGLSLLNPTNMPNVEDLSK